MSIQGLCIAAFAIVTPIAIGVLLPHKCHTIEETDAMLASLPHDRFEPIMPFLDESDPDTGAAFWLAIGQLKGTRERLHHMYILVRAIHARRRSGKLSKARAEEILRMALVQLLYSLLSVPESLLCRFFPVLPHICARAALVFHWRATLAAINAYLDATPTGPSRPANLFL